MKVKARDCVETIDTLTVIDALSVREVVELELEHCDRESSEALAYPVLDRVRTPEKRKGDAVTDTEPESV